MIAAESDTSGTVILPPQAASAAAARRHVARTIGAGPLADLVETASLLVSEVVTNAVLHAGTEIELTCGVEHGSLCVQVRDRSTVTPSPRHYDAGATTGRGLGLVELLAEEWGVEADEEGKTVWFLLAGPDVGGARPRPTWNRPAAPQAQFEVCLLNLPVGLVSATVQYGDAVLRELALLSMGSADGAGTWKAPGIDHGPLLGEAEAAREAGHDAIDLALAFPEGAGAAAVERLALVEAADRIAQQGELLTPAAVPEVGVCRRWLYGQISLQAGGAPPVAWKMPGPLEPVGGAVPLPEEELVALDALTAGAIVADEANRILYANEAAASRLGWEVEELVGQRLIAVVPPEQRAAHLAGFTRYLLTGEPRLLGRRIRLPALRRDGAVVDLDITIEMVNLGRGRIVFRAILW